MNFSQRDESVPNVLTDEQSPWDPRNKWDKGGRDRVESSEQNSDGDLGVSRGVFAPEPRGSVS